MISIVLLLLGIYWTLGLTFMLTFHDLDLLLVTIYGICLCGSFAFAKAGTELWALRDEEKSGETASRSRWYKREETQKPSSQKIIRKYLVLLVILLLLIYIITISFYSIYYFFSYVS